MPKLVWKSDPITTVQGYDARHSGSPQVVTPLVLWATWTVQSLHYLDDIDRAHTGTTATVLGHPAYVVDIANVLWATVTAITSLDLCAAALGRAYCQNVGQREMDLREFGLSNKYIGNRVVLPSSALGWIDKVLTDKRYLDVLAARNPFTHSWLNRTIHLSAGSTGRPTSRTDFEVPARGDLNARELVEKARDLATDQVLSFLAVFDQLKVDESLPRRRARACRRLNRESEEFQLLRLTVVPSVKMILSGVQTNLRFSNSAAAK